MVLIITKLGLKALILSAISPIGYRLGCFQIGGFRGNCHRFFKNIFRRQFSYILKFRLVSFGLLIYAFVSETL